MKVKTPPKLEEIFGEEITPKLETLANHFLTDHKLLENVQPESLPQPQKLELHIPNERVLDDFYNWIKEYYNLFQQHKATDEKGRYLHWDKISHKYGYKQAKRIWAMTKINRLSGRKTVKLTPEYVFTFCTPDSMQALLRFIDTACGSHLMQRPHTLGKPDEQVLVLEEAITSAQLEGAATRRKEAKDLLVSRKKPKDHNQTMIVNNYRLMQKVKEKQDEPLSIDLILSLHRTATENAIDNQAVSGAFRQSDDVNVEDGKNNIIHRPPSYVDLEKLMAALCDFANTPHDGFEQREFIHPIVKAILLHFFIGYIHPFGDGNGRTARALFYWFMLKNGYGLFEYVSISRLLKNAHTEYAKSYLYTETDDLDTTYFIYYQLKTIRRAVNDLKDYIERAQAEREHFSAEMEQFAQTQQLNERQRDILQQAVKHAGRKFTTKSCAGQFGVSENTVRVDLKRLAELNLLTIFKSGNATVFAAPADLSKRFQAT